MRPLKMQLFSLVSPAASSYVCFYVQQYLPGDTCERIFAATFFSVEVETALPRAYTRRLKKPPQCQCSICRHPLRHQIEMARVAGASVAAIGLKFGIHKDAVWRHCRDHLDEAARASYLADIPLSELAERANAESMVASGVNDGHRVAVLAGKAVIVMREIGKITGEVRAISSSLSITNINVLNTPLFTDLQAMLLARLASYPEALGEVVEGLRDLEAKAGAAPLELPPATNVGGAHAAAA
jgi:hypothetical protein